MATMLKAVPQAATIPTDIEKITNRLFDHFIKNPGTVSTVGHLSAAVGLKPERHDEVHTALHLLADAEVISARAVADGTIGIFGPLCRKP